MKKPKKINTGVICVSGLSSSNTSITSGTNLLYNSITTSSQKYHILGEDVEVSIGYYKDPNLLTNISILNVLGKPFLDELHKNNFFFPTEIEEYLENKFKWLERDKKIDNIIN